MKKVVLGLGVLGLLAMTSGPVTAQIFQNGPYYATPSWDQKTPVAQRFIVLTNWNNAAVLDQETGLVWERSPTGMSDWFEALASCHAAIVGNRLGWRLPGVEELLSLIAPAQRNPALPLGHPFQGIKFGDFDLYWTATTDKPPGLDLAYSVTFARASALGDNVAELISDTKTETHLYWCVRGGLGAQNPQ
jgi:hypothetical protein